MPELVTFSSVLTSLYLISCRNIDKFVILIVNATCDFLTAFYMVWDLNEETIKPRSPFNIHSEINYPILDDHYRNIIQFPGSFKFIEEINNSIIINDQYLVKSERYYISTAKFNHMRIQILPLALQNISTFRAKF